MSVRLRVTEGDDVREFVFDRDEISVGCGAFNDIVLDDGGGGQVQGTLEVGEDLEFECAGSGVPTNVIREEACISTVGGDETERLDVRVGDTIQFGSEEPVELTILNRSGDDDTSVETRELSEAASVQPGAETSRLLWRATDAVSRDPSPETLLRGAAAVVDAVVERRPEALTLSFLEDEGEVQDHIYRLQIPDAESGDEGLFPGTYERKRAPLMGLGVDRQDVFGALADGREYAVRGADSGRPKVFLPVGTESFRGVVEVEFGEIEDPQELEALGVAGALIQPVGRIVLQMVEEELESLSLAEENRYFRERERRQYLFKDIVCESEEMREVYRTLNRWVELDRPVLIEGEAGSGKSLLARALHHLGTDDESMLISLDCRALADEVLDSELYGCVESELVGAVAPRKGVFELADGGTVFLEEIDLLSPMMQSKLVRVLKEGEVRRIGDSVGRKVGARLVASTHRDLATLVERGAFRRDLYLQLCDHVLTVPPLRERTDDILPLARVYMETFADRYERPCQEFSDGAAERLRAHDWPGNARELKAVVESTVLKTDDETVVGEEYLTL